MNTKNLVVLMATYNGSTYIDTQIESIRNQSYPVSAIVVRDDGSTDDTVAKIMAQQALDERIQLMQDEQKNLGAIRNFFTLMQNAPNADYYALSDQDDFWKEEKMQAAMEQLVRMEEEYGAEVPLLYCSAKEIVDENLTSLYTNVYPGAKLTWGNALVENLATGCTCVMNEALRQLVIKELPETTVMHDWWIYMVAIALGKVYYDERSYIAYRQHSDNVHGEITSGKELLKYRLGQLFTKRGKIYQQIDGFVQIFGKKMQAEDRMIARQVVRSRKNWADRLSLVLQRKVYRQTAKDSMVAAFLVLTGKL